MSEWKFKTCCILQHIAMLSVALALAFAQPASPAMVSAGVIQNSTDRSTWKCHVVSGPMPGKSEVRCRQGQPHCQQEVVLALLPYLD